MADRAPQPFPVEPVTSVEVADVNVRLEAIQRDFEALFQDNANADSFLEADLNALLVDLDDGYLTNVGGVLTVQETALPADDGGTGFTSYAVGDLLYANTTATLAKLADVATGSALISGGIGVAPAWGKVGLTTHVSGVLPVVNGGTNSSTALSGSTVAISNGSALVQGEAGTSTTVLHGNVSGAPTYGAVILTTDVTGDLPFANIAQIVTSRLLGRTTAGTGDIEALTTTYGLTLAAGDVSVNQAYVLARVSMRG